ncbi:predicted protein [Histoplasma mississippiense (nom. inval.)]|uniref:predicted protein n=1 Tax=Ajellomyces capsulatus (strain NAm1 / WU24) TaxID=2059318 RepID=UPI000157BFE8|nr:predicted protein [Histoplasma mississippiense (nom. inval.)]EDN07049.1 predicted protein [Histoplasma mississippiense (nom. inval.)]
MSKSSNYTEEQLQRAVDVYKSNSKLKITSLSPEFKVPYATLYGRINGKKSRTMRVPLNRALNDSQEEAIKIWIHQLDINFSPPTIEHIEAAANRMLRQHHTDPETAPPTVSKMWAYRFIKRLPDYERVKQKPMNPKRVSCEDISFIINWFDRYEAVFNQYHFFPCDIYNFDEIGFQEGEGCGHADGTVLDPLIIMKSKVHLEDWYTHSNLPDNYAITASESGFTNDEIGFEWIKRFNKMTKKRQMGSHRLLLMDNHGSHLTEEFIQYCDLHKIILFGFPSHTSHILQPLDGVPFQQYKHYHTKAVNEAARYGYEQYGGRQFLANLESVRLQAFKPGTVRAGFADRGMYPVNRDIILNRLRPLTIDDAPDLNIYDGDGDVCNHFTPPPADRPSTASLQLTSPETVAKLHRQIDAAAKALQDVKDTLTPGLTRRLDKIFKGSMVQAELNAHREGELAGHYRANRRRVVKSSRRQVQVGGVLTIKDANRKIATRRADEMKKTFNKNLQSIGIKPTKSTATQPQQDNSIESQPTVDSTPSNE